MSSAPFAIALAAVVGAAIGAAVWLGLRPLFERPVFTRSNYRGVTLPTAVGMVIPVAMVFLVAIDAVGESLGIGVSGRDYSVLLVTLWTTVGFGLLGLVDDLAVDTGASGFKGHVSALLRGELNAGSLKLVAGPAIAIIVVAPVSGSTFWRLMVDAALVAAAANLANLFDRAPGRVLKVYLVAAVVLVAATGAAAATVGVAAVAGAAAVLLVPDLRERFMLGDAGANPLGAVAGLGVVLSTGPMVRAVVLVVVVALNLASEFVSFSAVIDRVGPLRVLDRAGRRAS